MIGPDGDRSGGVPDHQNGDNTAPSSGFTSGSKLLAAEEQLDEDLGDETGDQNPVIQSESEEYRLATDYLTFFRLQDARQTAEELEDQVCLNMSVIRVFSLFLL